MSYGMPVQISSDAGVALDPNVNMNDNIIRDGLTGPTTDTLPSSAQLSASYSPWGNGIIWCFTYYNKSDYDLTLAPGDDSTSFIGSDVVKAKSARMYKISGNSSGAVFESLLSFPIDV